MEFNEFNGRVNILSKGQPSFDYSYSKGCSADGYDIVGRDIGHTPVSALFFSKTNIQALQQGICNKVFNESRGKFNIGKQSESELKIIMRSFYFSYLKEGDSSILKDIQRVTPLENVLQPNKDIVLQHVRKLNQKVLDWSVQQIMTNIQQFEKYKSDVSRLPLPMERPSFVSSAGSKTLEFESFF